MVAVYDIEKRQAKAHCLYVRRQVKRALLDADVNLKVANSLIDAVKSRAIGTYYSYHGGLLLRLLTNTTTTIVIISISIIIITAATIHSSPPPSPPPCSVRYGGDEGCDARAGVHQGHV